VTLLEAPQATETSAVAGVTTHAVADADLSEIWTTIGITPVSAETVTPSKWWRSSGEMDVDLNGHDFDFKPRKNVGKEKVEGFADGPLSHNGWYKVLENRGNRFKIKVNVGTNSARTNDINVVVSIVAGKAKVTGTVKGTSLGDGVSANVKGAGTKSNPYSLTFSDSEGNVHRLEWRPD